MTTKMFSDTIDLVVKVNGTEVRRWELRLHPSIIERQRTRRWFRWGPWAEDIKTLPCVAIEVGADRLTAVGDGAELTIDIPVEVTM